MSSGRTLFWAGAIVASAVLIAPGLQRVDTPRAVAGSAVETPAPQPETQVGNGYVSQELLRNPDGHFYAEAQVNGAQIRFMIDTGATIVALTREDAQRAGIQFGSDRAMVRGVGGAVEVIPVTIDRLAIGSLTRDPGRGGGRRRSRRVAARPELPVARRHRRDPGRPDGAALNSVSRRARWKGSFPDLRATSLHGP